MLALEPNEENARLCAANSSKYRGVRVIPGALWPRETWLRIESHEVHNTEFRVVESPDPQAGSLAALTIPSLLKMAGADRVDILKIDIEGGEYDLFAGEADWIRQVGILIIEFHDRFRPGCAQAFYRALNRYALDFNQQISGDNISVFFNSSPSH